MPHILFVDSHLKVSFGLFSLSLALLAEWKAAQCFNSPSSKGFLGFLFSCLLNCFSRPSFDHFGSVLVQPWLFFVCCGVPCDGGGRANRGGGTGNCFLLICHSNFSRSDFFPSMPPPPYFHTTGSGR